MEPSERIPRARVTWQSCLAFSCVAVLTLQFFVIRALRTENAALRAQGRRIPALEDDSAELQRLRTLMAEPDRVRRDILELHRLRKEVQELRAGKRPELGEAEPEPTPNTNAPPVAPTPPTTAPLVDAVKSDWQFRGFDTPAATVETILWAGRENRVDVFLDSFVPEIREEFEEAMEEIGVTPALDAEDGPIAQATGLRVLSVVPRGSGGQEVELTYVVQGWHDDRPFRQSLRRTTAGWKFSGDPEDLD